MRITNKVMQNNSLNNINTNKILQDRLSSQMSTQKKISRPSEDPVVAVRALRLRTNVNQINQYYGKNVPDAKSWLDLTADAISSLTEVVTNMYENATKGSNENLTTKDKEIILTQLKSLRDEVYSTGNVDYAGRYVFTGYRTDTSLTFMADEVKHYSITEQLDKSALDTITYVDKDELLDITEANFQNVTVTAETDISMKEIHRLRISYQDVDGVAPVIEYTDGNGNKQQITCTIQSLYAVPSPYESAFKTGEANANDAILIPETGEILLGEEVYNKLMNTKDNLATTGINENEGEIRVTYQKSDWQQGDLRPEHYFACTHMVNGQLNDPNNVVYNEAYLQGIEEKQGIEYDVGMNQQIQVNTTADEVFVHGIGRDVDDMIAALEETLSLEGVVTKLEGLLKIEANINDPAKKAQLEEQLESAKKAWTFSNEKTQKLFEGCITKMQGHLDTVNLASTENGTRGQRLELISNRLMSQRTNYETLQSENEDADITEVAIRLSSAELTYNSSLMATGKILQNSLMNFI